MSSLSQLSRTVLAHGNRAAISLILASILIKSVILFLLPNERYLLENDSIRYLNLANDFFGNFAGGAQNPNPDAFYVTPGYPFFLYIFGFLGIKQIVLLQFLILGFTQFLVYRVLKNLFEERIALFGLSVFLLESSSNLESFHILTETLFSFFLSLFLLFLSKSRLPRFYPLLAGIALGLSLLIRPVAQILFLALCFTFFLSAQRKRIGICFIVVAIFLSGWILRNNSVYGVAQLSGIQSLNLLYFEGAGAVSMATSQSIGVAQRLENQRELEMLGKSPGLRELVSYRQERGTFLIKENFLGFAELHTKGAIKILIGPGSATIDKLSGGMKIPSSFSFAYKVFSLALSLLIAVLSTLAILLLLKRSTPKKTLFVFAGAAFVLLLVSSGGANAYSRFRVPIVPLEIILSMYWIAFISKNRVGRRDV